MVVAAGLTLALTQNTTTAAFTGQTSDVGNSVGTAADFCTSPGTSTLIATADTAVYQANATANYGATTGIGVGSGVGANAYSYIKFTLPSSLPAGCILTSAVLRLYASQSQAATISASRASVAWNGTTITWNTPGKPVPAGTPVNVAMPGVVGFQQWTVTTLTQELMAGPDYGFMLKDSVDNAASARYQTWDSIEAATSTQRPRLILTWG
jgi:large repetitive protein